MKLNKYLYKIDNKKISGDVITYSITLLPSCPIYSAHFPEMPITPGVCQIQLAKELTEDYVSKLLMIKEVINAKFVSVLIPNGQSIKVTLSKVKQKENMIKVQTVITDDTTTYAKLSLQTVIA